MTTVTWNLKLFSSVIILIFIIQNSSIFHYNLHTGYREDLAKVNCNKNITNVSLLNHERIKCLEFVCATTGYLNVLYVAKV
jgi:hypothetical protein